MPSPATSWSVRNLLSPVVTRLLICGTNPFDLERILKRVEQTPLRNARQLESLWLAQWDALATAWHARSVAAAELGARRTALTLGLQAASCRLAQYLINSSELALRRSVYLEYAKCYREAVSFFQSPVLSVRIPTQQGQTLAAHLHLPSGQGPHPCVAIFSGLGSCKEEMNTLARLVVERGVAALVPDMPGCGESLFCEQIVCGSDQLTAAFRGVVEFVEQRPELDASCLGTMGLCMGGGYAYRACHEQTRYRWCAPLFPLFIDQVGSEKTPQWMKTGAWIELQTGGKDEQTLYSEVGWRDEFNVDCPLFMVHGKHDNWMPLDRARLLYDHASSQVRELLVIDEEPAYSTDQAVTHTMPVGEQLSWVGPIVADWVARQAGVLP